MKAKIKDKWVQALRSGEYPQAQNRLQKGSGYCCLGVLCDIYNKSHKVKVSLAAALPQNKVIKWAELPAANPQVTYHGKVMSLAELNDKLGLGFFGIANLIRLQL